ncbi:CPBP family intramembrane glutamic endopeptidase [Anaerococcus marasmi]|uniref:CPBP family intramembrane glutamic endopeptidase n=1 Tax=Anaerococcus marasmi TaxID=2057797 RepID=UPI000CF94913|nr:CPBP family intramembrane glutamic endopeptidase [Anaerococcus marasmi]
MTTSNKNHLKNMTISKKIKNFFVKKKLEIFDLITIVIGSMSITGISLVLLLTLTRNASDTNVIIFSAFSLLLGFIIFPIYILKKEYSFNYYELGIKKIKIDFYFILKSIIAIVIFYLLSKRYDSDKLLNLVILQNISVSIAEEFLYRGIVTFILEKMVNKSIVAHVISGLIFVFVLHSGAGFLENIIYRLPITAFLCAIYYKFRDLKNNIVIHWLYNIYASSLI